MSDPFYTDLAEIKHNLSNLAVSLQKLLDTTPVRQNGTAASTSSSTEQTGGGNFDKAVVQEIVKLVNKLETQLKDLSDTFAIQTSNAKKLNLTSQELATRKEHVETHQKSFESMRENFIYLIKDDPAVHRSSKERKHALSKTETKKVAFEPITMDVVNPSSQPAGIRSFAVESDSDDELEIRHYQKDAVSPFATSQLRADSELGPLRFAAAPQRQGPLVRAREWITRSRRNMAIFAGSNVFVVFVIVLLIIAAF